MSKIPKIIHYCWFGKGDLPDLAQKCIKTWKEKLPDYEIKEWNESNFDININRYVKEAYENKKYAFVTDYVRLFALYNEGGIYMDTDVEVLKSLDEFLDHEAFSSFENNNQIPTGIMGSKPNNKWIGLLLEDYKDLSFVKEDGSLDLTTNVIRITKTTEENYPLKRNDTYQDLGNVVLYNHEYFSPKDWETGKIFITENTYTIHHFNGSWHSKKEKKQLARKKELIEKYGEEKGLEKYQSYLKRAKILNYFTYPIKAIKNPRKVLEKIGKKKK